METVRTTYREPTINEEIRIGPEPYVQDIPEEPSTLDVAAAAFRSENIVSSWYESLNYRSEEEDRTGYNPYEDLDEKYLQWSDEFIDVHSPEQREMKIAHIESRINDRDILARGGFESIIWSQVAGLSDPVMLPMFFIPAARVGAGITETAAMVAAAGASEAALSEYLLHQTQPTRTWQESMYAVGGAAVLGGALGGLAGGASKASARLAEKVQEDLRINAEQGGLEAHPDTGGSVGAARVLGTIEEEQTGKLGPAFSPLTRMLSSKSKTAVNFVNRMMRHNFYSGKNRSGQESIIPVEVENVRMQQGMAAKYLRNTKKMYKQAKDAGHKLSYGDFLARVGKAMRRGDADDEIAEVGEAAKYVRNNVITPITRGFQELGTLPEDLTTKFAQSYLPRVYDVNAIENNMDDWLELLTVHFTGKDTDALYARQLAQEVTDSILGAPTGRMPIQDVITEAGSLKERVLNIADEDLEDFLVSNVDQVMQTYLRTAVPDLNIRRAFAGDSPEQVSRSLAKQIQDEYIDLIDAAKTNRARNKLIRQRDQDVEDMSSMLQVLMGQFNPSGSGAKKLTNMMRWARGLSFMANLGMMTMSAIPDIARPMMQNGVTSWARAMPRAMLYWGKKTRLANSQLEEMGIGVDALLSTRLYALSEIDEVGTRLERFTQRFARYSGMNHWNSVMKKVAAFTAQNRFINDSMNYAGLRGARKERLAKAGINEDMAQRIAAQAKEHGEKVGTSWHANTNAWKDRDAANLFERVLLKDVDNTIVTPGAGDRPLFMHRETGKALLQFKSFFLSAHNQVFIPLMQQMGRGEASAFNGIMAGIGLGMMSEWVRLQLSDRADEMDDYSMRDWVRAGFDRGGIATVPMELINMTDRMLWGQLSEMAGFKEGSRYFYRNWLGSLLGPTFGYVSDAGNLMQNLSHGDGITAGDIHALRRLMPYQNMFYLRQLNNRLEERVAEMVGAEDKRRKRGSRGNTKTIRIN